MKKLIPILLGTLLLFGGSINEVKASHIPASNLTWTCDPNNPLCYTFIFTQVINCPSTNPTTMSSTYFTFSNDCGLANPTMGTMQQVGTSYDVAQTCPSATSTCAGGTVPGAWLATYEATVCLPADCDSWTIDYNLCCRDANSNTAGGSSNDMHIQSVLNTVTAPCNNGPAVTSSPIPYMCAGQVNTYCLTTADPDADSTYYQMTAPQGNGGTPIAYNAPYSVNSPLQNFTLDPLTGCMTFNQPTTGNFVVAVLIESYDNNGNLIASIIHDYQFEIITCTNTPPNQPIGGGIQNFNGSGGAGGGTQTGPNSVALCYNDNVCFDVVFDDPNAGNVLTITTDGTTLMPGATFTQTGTNPVTGTFCWTAQPGFTGSVVTFVVEDDACPIVGTNSFSVNFAITPGVTAGPDQFICGAQTAQLQASGGGPYTWSPATGLSCTNCPNPIASPATSTTYTVTGSLTGSCPNTDQVDVNVVFPFNLTATANPTAVCSGGCTQLDAQLAGLPPATSSCTMNATASGPDNTTCVTINNLSCVPAGETITAITMDAAFTGTWCPAWYTYDIIINGVTQFTNQCNVTGLNLAPYLPITSVQICSNDMDVFIDNITLNLALNITHTVTPTYAYSWTPTTGLSNPNIQNPTACGITGPTTYTVTAYDVGDPTCFTTATVSVDVSTVDAGTDVTICNGGNTTLGATGVSACGAGGSYTWAPAVGLSATNIANPVASPGATTVYTVTFDDGCGCTVTDQVTVTVGASTPPTMASTAETCDGDNDGTATATPVGMTPGYTYSWNTAPVQTTNPATGLAPGNYTVTVTDAAGCSATNNVNVAAGPLVTAGFTPPANQCLTGNSFTFNNTGSTGGTTTFAWDFGDGSGTSTQENPTYTYAGPGTYTVTQTVTDGPCSDVSTANVTVYDMPVPTAFADSVLCFGDATGSGTVNTPVTPGPGPFGYQWDAAAGNQITNPATNLAAGSYTVTVTDQTTNCTGQATITVFEPTALSATEIHVDPTCNGFNDGSATANPTGGTPGYTYSWNTIPIQTTQTATNLAAGTYTCTVTDGNGCTTTVNAVIVDPAGMVLNPSMVAANCGQPDGSTSVNVVSGGTGPYTYAWNTVPVQNTQSATNVPAGTYTVTVTDQANGCTEDTVITVTTTAGITATATFIQDALCNGSLDGQASAAPTGGTGPYTYSWNTVPVQTTSTLTAGAGTYTVVITDAFGCTGSDVVTINEPTPVVASISGFNDASCFGANDGDATGAGAGGTPGYTYSWNTVPVQNTQTATGLAPGTYIVTVTDNNGCPDTASVTIADGPLMTSTVTGSDVSCFGGNDGSADLTPNGGTGPYTYAWTPSGSTAEDPNGLTAGTHYVTITSQEGCIVNDTVTINEPPALVAVVDSSFDVICNGASDGLAYASASGGTPGYTYSWNSVPVQNTANATGLPFGVYTITVTDANGCTATDVANINEPPALTATTGSIDAYCGIDQGTVWVTPNNGTGPYTYAWDSAAVVIGNTDTVTGLYPGIYNLLVTDANGCTFTTTQTVLPAPGGTATVSAFTDVSCFGGNDGTATISVGGAFPGFTYQWDASAGSQTTNPATGLGLGLYNVTVTDTLGCVMTTSVTISEPTPLSFVGIAPGAITCPGSCDADAMVTMAGGTAPYTYQWDANASNQTTNPAVNLCDGTYSVVVTDNNGCTIQDSVVLSNPDSIVLNTGSMTASCNQQDGSAWVQIVSGAVGGTTVSWNTVPVQTTDTATNIVAGTYTVTVTDANGCTVTDTTTVANLNGPTVAVDSVYHVQCFGGNDGYIEVQVNGGVFPYTYLWDDPAAQTTPSASNLTAGLYTVTITDSNGCVTSTAVNVNEPTLINLTTGGVDPTCFTYSDGSAWASTIGGVGPYTYQWNTIPAQTTDSINGLTAGSYTVTVTDSNGCFQANTVILNDPLLFSVNVTGNNVTCFGACDGSAVTALTNGIAPFTYAWDDPSAQTTDSIFGLCDDSVNVIVTDAMGCIANGNVVITEPALLVVTENTHGDVSCNGGNDGFSSVNVAGGTGPYTFDWDLGGTTVSTNQNANNLIAGAYLVTVTDANGCTDQINIVITEPNALAVVATPTDADCFGANTGSAYVSVIGGTAPYNYQWTDPALQQTDTAFNLVAGSYDVTVTDSLGCVFTINGITINEPTQLVLNASTVSSTCGAPNGSASVVVGGGTPNYTYSWNTIPAQSTATTTGIVSGNYVVTVTDANGCVDSTTANVTDLGGPTVTIPTSTNVSCFGASDGTAQSNVVGGAAPYSYVWNTGNPADTLANVTGLDGQTYSVTVTDNNGCTASASVTINQNSGVSAVINASTNVSCFSGNDGDASVIAAGGAGGTYTYLWDDPAAQTTATATGLIAGTYIATVTDSNGCTATDTVIITEPTLLTVTLDSLSDVLCNAGSDGYINVIAGGGTPGFTYAWTPNVSAGATAAGLTAGNYSVTVTDANGCTANGVYDVFEPAQLVIDTVTQSSTCGNSNGSATVNIITQSTPGYTYAWNDPNNQTTATATGLAASNYVVTVTDANGCFVTQNVTVTDVPGPIIDSIVVTPVLCNGQNNGTANAFVSGTAPFTYQWDDPFLQTNQMATGLSASPPLYSVTVTDANGCTSISVAQVPEPNVLTAVINAPDTICYGEPLQLFANGNGGTLPYNYLWGGGQLGQGPIIENPTTSTVYTVDVQDANGCPAQATKTVIVRAPLQVSSVGTTICQGEVATLNATSTGGNPNNSYSYSWMVIDSITGNLFPTGVANPVNPINLSPGATTNYIVYVEDNGCSTPDTVGVTINVNDTATGQLVPVRDTCQGIVQDFALTTDIGVTFGWDFDSDGIIDQTTSSTTTQYVYPSAGTYDVTVTITTAQGCVSVISATGLATVNPNPIADFTTDPNPPEVTLINPTFDFLDQSFGADFWNWNFGDQNFDIVQNPTHTYSDTGYYDVQLVVTNIFGCTDTTNQTVRVRPDFFFAIPNTITPDGNGINDVFLPGAMVGATEDNYSFLIFDRWGELIFEGHDLRDGWDGTYKGKKVQNGVYVWRIEVTDMEGTVHNYTGHVNILR